MTTYKLLVVWSLYILGVLGNTIIGIDELESLGVQTNYGVKNNFCRLLAHKSVIINNKLYIDGGMAKFKVTLPNRTEAEVPDLNPYTVVIDLNEDFTVDQLPLEEFKRPTEVPVLNRFVIWTDPSKENYYISGGHFYTALNQWNQSDYYLLDGDIPGYEIWKYNIRSSKWSKQDFTPDSGVAPVRLISSADISIPEQGVSFAYGGYSSRRNRLPVRLPNGDIDDRNLADNSMLVYNHKSNTIRNITDPSDPLGYWHGSLTHVPVGNKGMLVVLMGEAQTRGVNFTENSVDDNRRNLMLDWKSVKIWDIEEEKWYTQKTTFLNDEKPDPRSRFCSVLVHDAERRTWDLWVYGGQNLLDPRQGVTDIWVLSMPSFTWIRIPETSGAPIRTHSCQAVGSQLIITGGYPPGFTVNLDETCGDSRLVRIYNMNDGSWPGTFKANGEPYKQRKEILEWTENRKEPPSSAGWASSRVKELFAAAIIPTPTPTPTPEPKPEAAKSKTPLTTIIGAAVGGVLAILLILLLLCCCGRDSHTHHITWGYRSSWLYKVRHKNTPTSNSSGYQSGLTGDTIAAYQRPGEKYELDPNNVRITQMSPTYHHDHRLSRGEYPHQGYDLPINEDGSRLAEIGGFRARSPHVDDRSYRSAKQYPTIDSHSTENVTREGPPPRSDNLSPISVTSEMSRGESAGSSVGNGGSRKGQRPPATSGDEKRKRREEDRIGSRASPGGDYYDSERYAMGVLRS